MVQTSLSAWLKKGKSEEEECIVVESNNVAVQESQQPALTVSDLIEPPQNAEELAQNGDSIATSADKSLETISRKLPPNATLAAITPETLPSFRRMTAILLPVPYPDSFYKETISDEIANSISMVALWTDNGPADSAKPRVVSGIRCRLLAHSLGRPAHGDTAPTLYISTITTLAPFRGHGLASALLRRVLVRAIREYGVTTVTAHMWEANEEARDWYAKHGFKDMHFDPNYYRKLKPSGAYLLEKRIGPQDLLGKEEDEDHG